MAGDEYYAAKGSLKLKGVSDDSHKKKKKSKKQKKEKKKLKEFVETYKSPKTDAELKFEARKRKMEEERIMKKASKSHKEKVEEFNRHLDNLTEHFDIPKVSWTK